MSSKESRLAVVNPCKYATVGKVHLLGGFNQITIHASSARRARIVQICMGLNVESLGVGF